VVTPTNRDSKELVKCLTFGLNSESDPIIFEQKVTQVVTHGVNPWFKHFVEFAS
jgi:hypothetical protein